MPIEQLLAMYGYGDRGGDGGNGETGGPATEERLAEEELDEEMEEDEEADDDDDSLESESSSSENTPSDKKEPATEDSAAPISEEAALAKTSVSIKSRSDLHLLYPSEEGNVPEARLLRSAGTAGATVSDEDADEEEDGDYAPGEDEWRKVIFSLLKPFSDVLLTRPLVDDHDWLRVSNQRPFWSESLRQSSDVAL